MGEMWLGYPLAPQRDPDPRILDPGQREIELLTPFRKVALIGNVEVKAGEPWKPEVPQVVAVPSCE